MKKRIIVALMVLFCIIASFTIYKLYRGTVVGIESSHVHHITLEPQGTKNEASWGNEARIKWILVDGSIIDFTDMELTKGWSLDQGILLFDGEGDPLKVPLTSDLNNMTIRMVKQNGSGKIIVKADETFVALLDFYSEGWQEEDYTTLFSTIWDRLVFLVTTVLYLLVTIIALIFLIKANEPKIYKNYLGMFDLFKGLGMIGIVLYHSMSLYNASIDQTFYPNHYIGIPMTMIYTGLIPAFLMIYGFSITISKTTSSVMKKLTLIARPYFYVMGMVLVITFFQWLSARDNSTSVLEGWLMPTLKEATTIGPMWFLLAMFSGAAIVSTIVRIRNKYIEALIVLIIFIAGIWILANTTGLMILYSFSIATTYIYIGYVLKKYKWFNRITYKKGLTIQVLAVFTIIVALLYEYIDGVPIWTYALMRETIKVSGGIALAYLAFYLSTIKFKWVKPLKSIGRYSLWVLCIHSIEFMVIPWEKLSNKLSIKTYLAIALIAVLRSLIIFIGCYLLNYRRRRKYE